MGQAQPHIFNTLARYGLPGSSLRDPHSRVRYLSTAKGCMCPKPPGAVAVPALPVGIHRSNDAVGRFTEQFADWHRRLFAFLRWHLQ